MKDKKYCKVRDHCLYTGEYRGAAHSVLKKIPIVFHNGFNYGYHFIIKELAEEKKKIICLEENTEKDITFTVSIGKEVWQIDKNGEEMDNLLIAQDLWQVHYQILSIIFLEEFIENNKIIKNLKHVELNVNSATVFLNTQILKMIW